MEFIIVGGVWLLVSLIASLVFKALWRFDK
jgi:hypothetical protein